MQLCLGKDLGATWDLAVDMTRSTLRSQASLHKRPRSPDHSTASTFLRELSTLFAPAYFRRSSIIVPSLPQHPSQLRREDRKAVAHRWLPVLCRLILFTTTSFLAAIISYLFIDKVTRQARQTHAGAAAVDTKMTQAYDGSAIGQKKAELAELAQRFARQQEELQALEAIEVGRQTVPAPLAPVSPTTFITTQAGFAPSPSFMVPAPGLYDGQQQPMPPNGGYMAPPPFLPYQPAPVRQLSRRRHCPEPIANMTISARPTSTHDEARQDMSH